MDSEETERTANKADEVNALDILFLMEGHDAIKQVSNAAVGLLVGLCLKELVTRGLMIDEQVNHIKECMPGHCFCTGAHHKGETEVEQLDLPDIIDIE